MMEMKNTRISKRFIAYVIALSLSVSSLVLLQGLMFTIAISIIGGIYGFAIAKFISGWMNS